MNKEQQESWEKVREERCKTCDMRWLYCECEEEQVTSPDDTFQKFDSAEMMFHAKTLNSTLQYLTRLEYAVRHGYTEATLDEEQRICDLIKVVQHANLKCFELASWHID